MAAPLGTRTKAAVLRTLFKLPTPARRLLAGPPVRIDGQEQALDAQLMIRIKNRSGSDVFTDPIEEARIRYDGLPRLLGYQSPLPVATREIVIPAEHGYIPATLYTPAGLATPSGLLLYYHGGGFSVGSRISHDPVARFFAINAAVQVLSVEYRRAPEHRFPAAVEDAMTAFDYACQQAADLGADPHRIAVGGDSAGGNLAAVTAQQATRRGGPLPRFQLLMYPPTDLSTRRPSRDLFNHSSTFTDQNLQWALSNYLPPGTDLSDPRLSPLHGDVKGLPPAYIATAGFDPLRDEGEAYANKLRAGGVPVVLSRQADLPHAFLNFVALGGRFAQAAAEAAEALKLGLAVATETAVENRY
ncbi:alpha/beta hydrolase [Mycobacterium branderi]|uniref:Alpha/beta hydrolase n=1 Tax=Mycobacterium branderi TaxID=43348 RepID=A0A7I7VZ55_9MYCO|nr:alpha/beta hydrolase [Mycobacterium branderi]MCV7233138.1 alpha/beta hydrolase [Mycobacterium branderi]ORA41229.1 alpha/beta hydrolase [Mycobacterium branderi]BBZ10250.1 alpha/beta hydrolase [Mycobacterium branderi]